MWCDNVKVKRCVVIEGMFGRQKRKENIFIVFHNKDNVTRRRKDEKSFIGVDLA